MKKAKVNLSAVRKFRESAEAAKNYSSKLGQGVACLEELLQCFPEYIRQLDGTKEILKPAKARLDTKIEEINRSLRKLGERKIFLNAELGSLKMELMGTPPTSSYVDSEGNLCVEANPEHEELKEKIRVVREELSEVQEEINQERQRLNRAESFRREIELKIENANEMIESLEEKQRVCRNLISNLKEVQTGSKRKAEFAVEQLKRIEEIITNYLGIKMKYRQPAFYNVTSIEKAPEKFVNSNQAVKNKEAVEEKTKVISQDEIIKHGIKFDKEHRICEYDGKTFGGAFNSYDVRLNRTSLNTVIYGQYTGVRGESKYIPSARNAKGVAVIDILKTYGLDGIEYRNAEPDFETCSEAVVQIQAMSENRLDYRNTEGNIAPGNFKQADIELAKVWNHQLREGRADWIDEDVKKFRKNNRLTWHEKCDTSTMVLVRLEINDYFKHSGGCAECKARDTQLSEEEEFDE